MSVEAAGNWGKGALQFRGGLKSTHAYRPAPPGTVNQGPATPAQLDIRAAYHGIHDEWITLTAEERAAWNASATATEGLSGWNLYLKTRMLEGLAPADALVTDQGDYLVTDQGDYLVYA